MMKTPNFVALPLCFSGDLADYTEDAERLDGKIAILYVLREADGWPTAGRSWLKKHMPNSGATAFGLAFYVLGVPIDSIQRLTPFSKSFDKNPVASGGHTESDLVPDHWIDGG